MKLLTMDAIHSGKNCITVVYATDNQRVDQGNCSVSRQCSSDRAQLPQTMETATRDTFDVITKCQLLVDGDAEAGNSAEKIDS